MWAVWRIGAKQGLTGSAHGLAGLAALLLVGGTMILLGAKGILPRTARFYFPDTPAATPQPARESV